MTLHFYHAPFLFHEAVELLFHYTNGQPMPELPQEKHPYCIPAAEMERMMEEICRDIPWENEVLQDFFRQYKLPASNTGSFSCLARVLAFSFVDLGSQTARQAVDSIIRRFEDVRESGAVFDELRPFTINTHPGSSPDAGIPDLNAPASLRKQLLRVYRDPVGTLQPLISLIEPVMARLQTELRPWAFRAEPMLKIWEDTMNRQTPERFFRDTLHYDELPPITSVELGIVYFLPQWLLLGLENDQSTMKIFIGAGTRLLSGSPVDSLMGWEYRALQLLSSPVRMRMLHAMHKKPMSSRELAQELNLHLGTVTRDINSMDEAYLLNVIPNGARRRYTLNCQAIRTLAEHLLQICENEE